MRNVRAKFRVLSVTKKWDGWNIVELGPVLQNGPNPENKEFWRYTPSGSCTLNFFGPPLDALNMEYEAGSYYYLDMHKDDDGGWCLASVTHNGENSGGVELCTNGRGVVDYGEEGFRYGRLEMGLDHAPALEWFDNPGGKWSVVFTFAEHSDN